MFFNVQQKALYNEPLMEQTHKISSFRCGLPFCCLVTHYASVFLAKYESCQFCRISYILRANSLKRLNAAFSTLRHQKYYDTFNDFPSTASGTDWWYTSNDDINNLNVVIMLPLVATPSSDFTSIFCVVWTEILSLPCHFDRFVGCSPACSNF